MRAATAALAVIGMFGVIAASVPARAEGGYDDGWQRHEWREQRWREHEARELEWREHELRERDRRAYAPPAYYTPPPAYYAAPPRAYYAPPPPIYPAPGMSAGFGFR